MNFQDICVLQEMIDYFLMQTHKSYFSYRELLHRPNVCTIFRKKNSGSRFLFQWWNSSFGYTVLKIVRMSSPNKMWLQRTKDDNIFMVFDLLTFKWPIQPNGILEKFVVKTKIRSLNITFLDKFFCRITTRSTKSLFLHKNLNRKNIAIFTSLRFRSNGQKTAYTQKKIRLTFNVNQNLLFCKIWIS